MKIHPTVELTQALVRIPSENPHTPEQNVSNFVADWFRAAGDIEVKCYEVQPGRTNVVGRARSDSGAPPLAILAHMDTVPVGKGWSYDPFGGEIADGRLYGRGSCDMKAGLAVAMSVLKNAQRKGGLKRDFLVCATIDEEGTHMLGGNDLIEQGVLDKDSLVIATEPTDLNVVTAHKGLVWMEVIVEGRLAHAGHAKLGVDAVRAAAEFITLMQRRIEALPYRHDLLGPPTVTFSGIQGGIKTNVVPNYARMELDIRLTPPMTTRQVHDIAQACGREIEALMPGARFALRQFSSERPPVQSDEASALVTALRQSVEAVSREPAKPAACVAYTDAAVLQARTGNATALVFGPGSMTRAHTVDEYVPVDEIVAAEAVLTRTVEKVCF
jgi:succinyl-diaminopimelate desuccinylase